MKTERNRNTLKIRLPIILLFSVMLISEGLATPAQSNTKKAPLTGFATVGNTVITWQEYQNAYTSESNTKFYHAKPNENELAAFQRQVGDKLVNDALLVQEANRRKLQPDNEAVNQELQKYEQRFANDPNWSGARPRVLPIITKRLQNENIRNQLEKLVRDVPAPTEKQLHEYYNAHPDKFTAPPQPRISVILIRVDPSSSEEEWQKATEEAQGLVKRARAGEDFAALAHDYSGDVTAEEGGDMGYLHTGMLPGLPEETVSKLQPGETSDPVRLLEGVAIFRLTDRIQAKTGTFEDSQERVSELLRKEQSDTAWAALITQLKKKTSIHIDESRFLPLPAVGGKSVKPQEDAGTPKTTLPATK